MKKTLFTAVATGALLVACTPDGDIEFTGGSSGSAESAIAQLGITETEDLSFESAGFEGDDYVITNLVIRDIDNQDSDTPSDLPEGKTLSESNNVEFNADEVHIARMVLGSPRLDANGDLLLSSFNLSDIRVEDPEDESGARLDSFVIDGPNAAMSADIGRLLRGELDDEDDTDWSEYAFNSFSMQGFNASDNTEGENTTVSFDNLTLAGVREGDSASFEFRNLLVEGVEDGAPIEIRLGEISIDGMNTLDYGNFLGSVDENAGGEIASNYSSSFMSNPFESFENFAMRDFLVNAAGVNVSMDYITADVRERGDRFISTSELGSLVINADPAGQAGAQLAMGLGMLGYDQLEIRAAGRSIYDTSEDRMYTDGDNFLEIVDGMRIDFESDVTGYGAYLENAATMMADGSEVDATENPEAVMAMLAPLMINNITMRIEDRSILDRALEAGAASQGVEKEQMRMQAGLLIGMGLMSAPPEIPRPFLTELSGAVTGFINQGGTLTVTMDPDAPLPISSLIEQADSGTFDFDSMGLRVESAPVD